MKLFKRDEEQTKVLQGCIPYLNNERIYNYTKKIIKKLEPTFIIRDIYTLENLKTYDNIFLSNLAQYTKVLEYKEFIDKINNHLNKNGTMLLTYLYDTEENTSYQRHWSSIYNLEVTKEVFSEYISEFKTFPSVNSYKFNDDNMKDSAIIYRKVLRK